MTKKVITVKQTTREVFDRIARCNKEEICYKIIKLNNSVAWEIGGTLSRQNVDEIIRNKIAEVIVT